MKKIIPISDLQLQVEQLVSGLNQDAEPIIITQDQLELRKMLIVAEAQIAAKQTISHQQVKERLAKRS